MDFYMLLVQKSFRALFPLFEQHVAICGLLYTNYGLPLSRPEQGMWRNTNIINHKTHYHDMQHGHTYAFSAIAVHALSYPYSHISVSSFQLCVRHSRLRHYFFIKWIRSPFHLRSVLAEFYWTANPIKALHFRWKLWQWSRNYMQQYRCTDAHSPLAAHSFAYAAVPSILIVYSRKPH